MEKGFASLAGNGVCLTRNLSRNWQRVRVRGTTGAAKGKGDDNDDEATQVPAASAKMESGRATTEKGRGTGKEGEGARGSDERRAREMATNFSAGFLDDRLFDRCSGGIYRATDRGEKWRERKAFAFQVGDPL